MRPDDVGTQVLLVHRVRWDDWSLPKGKLEPGETSLAAALREVHEETGLVCQPAAPLGTIRYGPPEGPKETRYWLMAPLAGTFVANGEVDAVRWLALPEAIGWATHAPDRQLLRSVAALLLDLARRGPGEVISALSP